MQKRTRVAGIFAAAACAVGMIGSPAFAAVSHHGHGDRIGNISVLDGNTVNVPISIPIDVCGNAIAILGFAEAGCQGGAAVWLNQGW